MKIAGSGLSGLVGRRLVKALENEGHRVTPLKRAAYGEWLHAVNGADAVVNLSGENLAAKRWTAGQKAELRKSRLETTRAIVGAIAAASIKPKVLLNASAVGFYGPSDSSPLDEGASPGSGFLAEMCREWEEAAKKAEAFGVRVVLLRTGIVLAKEGGALAKMLPPFKFFIGGPLGSGKQVMSWVHIEDEVGAILHCLSTPMLTGPVNLTAPGAVTMKEFAKALGNALHRPAIMPVPAIALKIFLGEMSEMLLTGQHVLPKKLEESGYHFRYSNLDSTLKSLLA